MNKIKNILLAEDNIENQQLMSDMMEFLDYNLDIAKDGKETIEKWKNKQYDLIIMDIHMPEMDGYQASKIIRELENKKKDNSHIPILAVTASATISDRDKCYKAGMDYYLSKPITIDIIEKKLLEIFK